MRLHVVSDLHLEAVGNREFRPSAVDADVVVLAGDIAGSPIAAAAFATAFYRCPIVAVLGNHEFFGGSVTGALDDVAEINGTHEGVSNPVHMLERQAVVIGGTRFVGCTLWSDFALFGEDREREAMATAKRQIPDFVDILLDEPRGGRMAPRFTPADARDLHRRSRLWLGEVLSIPFDGPTVVVTHHAPSGRSIAPLWADSLTSAAFASNMEDLVLRHQPDLWIHGHVHDSADYEIGRTRIVCNPRGYSNNRAFKPDLVVEVSPELRALYDFGRSTDELVEQTRRAFWRGEISREDAMALGVDVDREPRL